MDDVLPDEYPLTMLYEALSRRLKHVIASNKGIRATASGFEFEIGSAKSA